jgi:arylsulfatase A-like enzyme
VIFSLYLLGDAFFRWDGFRYYATFNEFIPAFSLIIILWSSLAICISVIVWLMFSLLVNLIKIAKIKVSEEGFLFFVIILSFAIGLLYVGKVSLFKTTVLSTHSKLVVLACTAFLSIVLTWMLRNKIEKLMVLVQEHLTPLVWIFSVMLIVSVPLVLYHALLEKKDEASTHEISSSVTTEAKKPNIILVTFDALSSKYMSVYGYNRPTTPFISKWAETASLFTMAEAESNYTTPTVASMMTGKRVWTHQTYYVEAIPESVRRHSENLPILLKENGYSNVAIVTTDYASVGKLGIEYGFEIAPSPVKFRSPTNLFGYLQNSLYSTFGDKIKLHDWLIKEDFAFFKAANIIVRGISKTMTPPEKAFNKLLEILDKDFPEPFFAWIHIFPPHDPYLPPEPFVGTFEPSPELRTSKSQKEAKWQDNPAVMAMLNARYDEFILYCDKKFEEFISELEQRSILNKSIVILSSDHGESFEHNYLGHGGPHLFEHVTNIPLIIKEPDQTRGRVINDIVEQIDIPATILDLTDIPIPSWVEGRSLIPLMRGKEWETRQAFSMNLTANPSRGRKISKGTIAVWDGDYKLIHYLANNKSFLFNIEKDPGELNNIFEIDTERGQRLLMQIKENLKEANLKILE